jgi:hypothetical protein
MARERLGGLPTRYSFILNPYPDQRLSKCPQCEKLTHMRKFALFIHIDGVGPLALGKTCRYCSPCELIMAHKVELDAEIEHALAGRAPEAVGNEYMVLGTLDRKLWQRSLEGGQPLAEALKHIAEFKKHLTLHIEPGGWVPASGAGPHTKTKPQK